MHPVHRQPPSPRISFIICKPVLPKEQARIVLSLQSMAFHDFECIVVNHAPTGPATETTGVIDNDPRFHIAQFQASTTVGAGRNTGLRLARAPYIALLQDACSFIGLQDQLARLDASGYAGLHLSGDHAPAFYTLQHLADLRLGRSIVRTDVARMIGGFAEAVGRDDETEFFCRLLNLGHVLASYPTEERHVEPSESSKQDRKAVRNGKPSAPSSSEAVLHCPAPGSCGVKPRKDLPVLFIPHKDYHVWTIGLLAPRLKAMGIDFLTLDLTPQWGEAGVRSSAERHGIELLGLGEFVLGRFTPRVTVTFNDWDYISRPLVLAARTAGLTTVGIVEGIQDYDDADIAIARRAYRLVENVILPGAFDYRYFANSPGQRIFITGVPRIQTMRDQPQTPLPAAMQKRILINSNFSYGVLTQHRDAWLTAAVHAVEAAGYQPVISRHPADKGVLFPELVSTEGFYETLKGCCACVQRFASGMLEAIAYNKPVFYFNVHKEKVDKFTFDPMGAYPVSYSEAGLIADLRDLPLWQRRVRDNGPAFLDLHAGKRGLDIVGKTSEIIAALSVAPVSAEVAETFHAYLATVDAMTDAFCAPDRGIDAPFFNLDEAAERLERAVQRQGQSSPRIF